MTDFPAFELAVLLRQGKRREKQVQFREVSEKERTKKGNVTAMSWQSTFNTTPNPRGQVNLLFYQKTH